MRRTYKKVLNIAPASHAAGTVITIPLAIGTDSLAPGQTTVADATCPTGAKITSILIQFAATNLAATASFYNMSIQYFEATQAVVDPRAVGGNPQRNQVLHQELNVLGENQNFSRQYLFRIPKKFQRLRELRQWSFVYVADNVWSDAVQVIYKFET